MWHYAQWYWKPTINQFLSVEKRPSWSGDSPPTFKVFNIQWISTLQIRFIVFRWLEHLQAVRQSPEDNPRSGRPTTAVNENSIDAVQTMLDVDRRVTVCITSMKSFRWVKYVRDVSRLSSRKDKRVRQCQVLWVTLEDYGENFWRRLVTANETRIPYYKSEAKEQYNG